MTDMMRAFVLRERPVGLPTDATFDLQEQPLPELGEGEIRVQNKWLTVDPYMRGRMMDRKSYIPPFQIGAPLEGGAVGEVVESRDSSLKTGDLVVHMMGWRDVAQLPAKIAQKIDPTLAPPQAFLGVLGMPGLTAYAGVKRILEPRPDETLVVSGAAGAVGSLVCQLGKIHKMRVVGSAGSAAKIDWLNEIGVDAAFNYKEQPYLPALKDAAPKGVDCVYENVGGDHLDSVLALMNRFGRIALCGVIANYNLTEAPTGLRNYGSVLINSLKMQGFIVSDHADLRDSFLRDMAQWLADHKIHWRETIIEGLEATPSAFLGLFKGENIGKMLVKLSG